MTKRSVASKRPDHAAPAPSSQTGKKSGRPPGPAWREAGGTAVRRGRDADNEVAMGGWPGAIGASAPAYGEARSAEPIGGDASFEERGAASERKLARLAVARSAPPWTSSLANRQKKGPVPRRVMAGTGPEGYRYAAARSTGIPILRALSIKIVGFTCKR